MKLISALPILLLALGTSHAEDLSATDLLKRIDQEKPITLTNTTINGDLDFTQLQRKTRGGSYGGRVGRVKEFFTKLRAPLVLEDCTINGNLITYREERRRLLLKENFVAFDAPLTLKRCRILGAATFEKLAFYDRLTIEDCVFEKEVRIEKVDFKKPPRLSGNSFKRGLKDKGNNWNSKADTWVRPKSTKKHSNPGIPVSLRNPSGKSIGIVFGDNHWNLSPRGTSTLQAAPGTKVYLTKDGKKERVLLTVTPEIAGKKFDVTRL